MCGRILRQGDVKEEETKKGFFHWMLSRYETSLEWVLGRQPLTMVTFVSHLSTDNFIAYIIIPKGDSCRSKDTGQIIVSTDAGETVSFKEMMRLQQQAAEIIQADKDVAGVASFLGVGTTNITAE